MKYVIQSNSFVNASRAAAFSNMHLSEWEWLPLRHINDDVKIFEVQDND